MDNLKTGLWEKKSQKGNIYYAGKIKINNKDYKITLFKVIEKKNEKSPDYNIILEEIEKKEENKKEDNSQVFVDFGNQTGISDEDIAF